MEKNYGFQRGIGEIAHYFLFLRLILAMFGFVWRVLRGWFSEVLFEAVEKDFVFGFVFGSCGKHTLPLIWCFF